MYKQSESVKNCLLMIGSHRECYQSMKSCHYIGPAYRPHPAIPCVDSAAHGALTQGRKIAVHDANTYIVIELLMIISNKVNVCREL